MVCLVLSVFEFGLVPTVKAQSWLTGWGYRKSHVINYASGAGTLYQVKITCYYGSGTDSGGSVYLNSHSRTDFGDVRFTDNDGTTLLDCWMENYTASNNAVFWVEVADDLSTVDATIYVYYGKSDATTTSNGDNTFRLFDHFDDGSLNTAKWDAGGVGTIAESGTVLTITSGNTVNDHKYVTSDLIYATGVAVEVFSKTTYTAQGSAWEGMAKTKGAESNVDFTLAFYYHASYTPFLYNSGNGSNYDFFQTALAKDTSYRRSSCKRSGTTDKLIIEGAAERTGLYPTSVNRYVTMDCYTLVDGAPAQILIDWVAVRKYVDPEPAHGAWGSEETGDTAPPTYSLPATPYNETRAGYAARFDCLWNDNTNVTTSYFCTNNTGVWSNSSVTMVWVNTTAAWANYTITLNSTVGVVVAYLWNCSDAVPNWNTTMPMQTVTTTYYASLTINTSSHTFSLNPGDNNITVTEGSISLTITSNANFNVQAYGADLVSGSYSIPVGNLLMSQSSLASAVNMTVSYQNIPGLTNQASGSNLSKSFVLWLSCPLGTRALTYSYTLHVRVVIAS